MAVKLKIVLSDSDDVFFNQALEYTLFDKAERNEAVLYLWTNERTVVIGRNQCALDECDVDRLESDGGALARRLSGGGAVYHDGGNLNYTFISQSGSFDKDRNNRIILDALSKIGADARLSGRNDIEIDGAKISGNAYYSDKDKKLHHGTLLITSSAEEVAKYLKPPTTKRRAVGSVVSRVSNLKSILPEIAKQDVINALIGSFADAYSSKEICGDTVCGGGEEIEITKLSEKDFERSHEIFGLKERFSDKSWRYGKTASYTKSFTAQAYGRVVTVKFNMLGDVPTDIEINTDSLDFSFADKLRDEIKLAYAYSADGVYRNEIDGDINIILEKMREFV